MLSFMVALASTGWAGGLDLLEVGGVWGTPGADNPTALWWNPGGLARGEGTQVFLEVAPTFGAVTAMRDNPDYGPVDPAAFGDSGAGAPDSYDYSGTDVLSTVAPVPFLGVSTDFGVEGLGVGASLSVPFGKGGALRDPEGPNRFHLRSGDIQAIYASVGGAYEILDHLSVGVSGSMVNSWWSADTDVSLYSDLANAIPGGVPDSFQDGYAELPGYAVGTVLTTRATSFTFGAGVSVRPLGDDRLDVSLSYNHGVRLDHEGEVRLQFACPPAYDDAALGAATGLIGICSDGTGASATGTATIGYNLPNRLHLGVTVRPTEQVRLEVMAGAVFWSAFGPYEIGTLVSSTQFPDAVNANAAAEAATISSQPRTWARDHRDTFWAGVDGKVGISDRVSVGGRALFDRAAIEAQSVSANNYDADALHLTGMVDVIPTEKLGLTLSFTQQFLAPRTVTESPYRIAVDQTEIPVEYRFPSANGTYTGRISRVGVAVRARL